ncbi:MAG: 30S ribosome-binding factor RbfA [Opitutales bacterium]|jgi:ribosome-binding factor A
MSRAIRVNELVMRELSDLLHTRFRDRAVGITVTEVEVAQGLRSARVFYSVLGDARAREQAEELLAEIKGELRARLGKRVVLKYTPSLEFVYDESQERGSRTLTILDELAAGGEFDQAPEDAVPPPETKKSD